MPEEGPLFSDASSESPEDVRVDQVDTKKCPSCAEMVKAEALICRFCGFDFRTGTPGARTAQAAQAPTRPAPEMYAPRPARTNGFAIASLVLGIVWIWGIGSILALVFGYVGKGQIDRSGGYEGGRGMAIAGIVLGWIGVAGIILFIIVAIAASTSSNPSF